MFSKVPAGAFADIIIIVNALLREKNEAKYKQMGIDLALNLLNNGMNSDLTLILLSRLNLLSFFSQRPETYSSNCVPIVPDEKQNPLWMKITQITMKVRSNMQYMEMHDNAMDNASIDDNIKTITRILKYSFGDGCYIEP